VSLNNDRVFFIERRGSESKIVHRNLIDGAYTELSSVPPGTNQVSFSPDGSTAAYHVDLDDRQQVYLQDVRSGERRVLLSAPEDVGFPRFSRDGSLIHVQFTHRENGGNDIAVIPAKGGPLEIVLRSDQRNFGGGWMPDNDHILFAGFRDAVWNIYSISRSTKEIERLTDYRLARTYVRYPDWLGDGRLVYEFNEVKGNIFIANLQ
jgi:TolB protein